MDNKKKGFLEINLPYGFSPSIGEAVMSEKKESFVEICNHLSITFLNFIFLNYELNDFLC